MALRRQRLAALGAVLLAFAGCGEPSIEARPAMWRVSDGDTTIYLLGSIHLLPPKIRWRTPLIEHVIATSGTLVLESSPEESVDFGAMARGVNLQPARDRVSPGKREILDAMIARSGIARETLDGYKDWALATTLATGDAVAAGATTRDGVEAKLWSTFRSDGKTRLAFYHAKDQLDQLDALPEADQRKILENTLSGKENYGETLKAWTSGDIAWLEKTAECTPLEGKLVGQPNDRWAQWINARMKKPGIVLVAVGLGHMAGPYALPKLLAARGLKVERIE
ncbi:TraB/GumN family protein [Sphingomonas pruni]|uniref:TraB/GumN family protein n=1 Tax=Sphingomonas pruni TaxID=40683 RepID=UPI0008317D78|nr:TraB/GumN family protein [Sphingomonas pruni]